MRGLALCCAVVSAILASRPARAARRVRSPGPVGRRAAARRSLVESPALRTVVCAVSVALVGWAVAGTAAGALGAVAGLLLSIWIGRLESPTASRERAEVDRDLAVAVDLLAACAATGGSPEASLAVVQRAIGGALGARLGEIGARLSLGADPVSEWDRWGGDANLAGLARAMRRSAESGAPLADGLARVAEDHRRDRRVRTQVRARSVGVKAAGQLAACFLPAFVLVGVVPTVVGSFQQLFG